MLKNTKIKTKKLERTYKLKMVYKDIASMLKTQSMMKNSTVRLELMIKKQYSAKLNKYKSG